MYKKTICVCWNSIVSFSSNESVLTCVIINYKLQVEVKLYGHWDVPLFEGGQVHSLHSDKLLAQ